MADNIVLNAGAGGATLAADDIASVWYQIVKLAFGAADSATNVTTSAGLPVQQQGTWVLGANSGVDIGDVTVNNGAGTASVPAQGAAAEGAAVAANPVLIAGWDGTNVRSPRLFDGDSGAGTQYLYGVSLRKIASGGSLELGTSTDPLRVDPTGTTAQPVTDNAGSLTVDSAQLPAALVGGRLDVVVGAALPAGANNIGDVDVLTIAAGDNNIGNVDIVTMPNVTLAAGTNTNEVVGDVAHDAPIAGNPLTIGGVASAAAPTNVSLDQDAVRAWFLLNGAQAVNVTAAGALIAGDATNGLDVDVTRLPALVAGSANIGDVDVLTVPAPLSTTGGGTEATALRVTLANDSTGLVSVDDNGGTLTVDQATASNLNAQVVGEIANDAVDSGNPVKVGGLATGTLPTAVASADRVNGWFDRHGAQHVRTGAEGTVPTYSSHVPAANTQATATRAAGAAGVRNVCTSFTAVLAAGATAPTAVNLVVNIIDGASGGTTYLWRSTISLPATAGATNGIVNVPCWLVGTAATALTIEFSAAGGANTFESVTMSTIQITE